MNTILSRYLCTKHILVSNPSIEENNIFECLYSLAHFYGIKVVKGAELVNHEMIMLCGLVLGNCPPYPFYRGFPETVKSLSQEKAIYDQLINYFLTYGLGDFDTERHSLFEKDFERTAFCEDVVVKEFSIVTEKEAYDILCDIANNLCLSSRPLNDVDYEFVLTVIKEYGYIVKECNCKDTLVKLIRDSNNIRLAQLLKLSDVIRFVEYIAVKLDQRLNKLNLPNSYRKMITKVLDYVFEHSYVNTIDCFEKQKTWVGLLHHIHYVPKCDKAKQFVDEIRNSKNKSIYSTFEKYMSEQDIKNALIYLKNKKGDGAVLRNLDYILSRCKTEKDLQFVMDNIDSTNTIILMQLLYKYYFFDATKSARTFKYVFNNKLRTYNEKRDDISKRKSLISLNVAEKLFEIVRNKLQEALKNKLGKVYISKDMYKYGVPLQNQTSNGGFGILPTGSRIKISSGKKIRSFIYWEQVNDIDLSLFVLHEDKWMEEVSWRTYNANQKTRKTFIFSGDCTSGYDGGSEYFDIDLDLVKQNYDDATYLILSANVFSGLPFSSCICKAGYMTRDEQDSGEIYEPKTVQSAYAVTSDSTYAMLYAIDLNTRELVWLNVNIDSFEKIAANYNNKFVINYINLTNVFNVGILFEMLATEVVDDPSLADVIVSDESFDLEDKKVIKSYDIDKILALLNK